MSREISIKVIKDGTGEAIKWTRELLEEVILESTKAVEAQAKLELQREVYDKPESPTYRRTGFLMASTGKTVEGITGTVYSSADYAVFVHEGTRHMAPRPYLDKALDHERPRLPARARRIARQQGMA